MSTTERYQYYFKKLSGKIYALSFSRKLTENAGISDTVYMNLMKCLFFTNNKYKNRFINFSETKDEISLFLDKYILDKFFSGIPDNVKQYIKLESNFFKLFEIYCLDNDLYKPGSTAYITEKFAKNNISCICTNSYSSSFILVQERDYRASLNVLKDIANCKSDEESSDDD